MEAIENMENEVDYDETEDTETEGSGNGWMVGAAIGLGAVLALAGKKFVYDPLKAKLKARKEAKRLGAENVVPFNND